MICTVTDNSKALANKEGQTETKGRILRFPSNEIFSNTHNIGVGVGVGGICFEICFTATTNFHASQTAPNWDSSFGAQQLSAISFIYSISKSQTQRLLV